MALSAPVKLAVRRALHRAYSAQEMAIPWVKADVDAAITALDDFLDANVATINSALPNPFRSTASTGDKAVLMATITMARYLVDSAELAAVMSSIVSDLNDVAGV